MDQWYHRKNGPFYGRSSFHHSDRRHGQLHEHFVQGIYTLNQRVTPIGEKLFRNYFVIMKWTNGEQVGYFHIQENKLPLPLEIFFWWFWLFIYWRNLVTLQKPNGNRYRCNPRFDIGMNKAGAMDTKSQRSQMTEQLSPMQNMSGKGAWVRFEMAYANMFRSMPHFGAIMPSISATTGFKI